MKTCQVHNVDLEFKQGVKKETGKSWAGYFCPVKGCKTIEWAKTAPASAPAPAPASAPKATDEKSVKTAIATAFIKAGKTYNESKIEANAWFNWAMGFEQQVAKVNTVEAFAPSYDPELESIPF